MENFDEKLANPDLIESAIIEFSGQPVYVVDMDNNLITIQNDQGSVSKISNDEWMPYWLDEGWLKKLNIDVGMSIRNCRNGDDWTLRRIGKWYYLTTNKDISLGENPVIPVHYVHNLQEWYYRLTNTKLKV